jgi:hypothetical protein
MTETIVSPEGQAGAAPAAPKKKAPTALGNRLCGFCKSPRDASGVHTNCPGAVANGDGQIIICPCKCKGLICRECRGTENIDPTTWLCIDRDACRLATQARRAAARAANGYTLPDVPVQSRKFAGGATEPRGRAVEGSRPRKAKDGYDPKPFGSRCHCGCKGLTKGGRFLPGHDAKLKSILSDQVRTHKDRARRIVARAEQLARGTAWSKGCDAVAADYEEEAKKLIERQGADGVVAFQVKAREQVAR